MKINSEKGSPLISVCVPVYNSAEYLDKCLGCLTRQTYENIEIILVIDGDMEDKSEPICHEWARRDHRIRVIKQPHGGLPVARNTGIDTIHGDLAGFVDPDDYIEIDMYERLYEGIQSSGADICIEGYIEQDEGKYDGENKECFDKLLKSEDAVEWMINQKISDYPWNKLYKSKLFDGIRYPEGNNFYDVGTTYMLLEKAKKVRLIPYAGYHYVRRSGSLTGGRRIPDFLDSIEMYIDRYDRLKERRSDLKRGLCKGIFGSCVSLAAACLVSGNESRKENITRRRRDKKRIIEICRKEKKFYSGIERTVMKLSVSESVLGLVTCLGLEQIRRWIKGK